ncbi:hypothetical protein ACA910_013096 [Epithemia clementina (nom. ined.)]
MAHIPKVLHQNTSGSWGAWDRGSQLVFWRWNGKQQQHDALHGLKIFVKGSLPQYTTKARPPKPLAKAEVQTKLGKVIDQSYIDVGHVKSLIDYFAVRKGPTDIRLVYNGSSSGLNAVLWAPSFWLPSSASAERVLSYSTFCVDLDLGDMFLNFPMDPAICPYSGVNASPFRAELESKVSAPLPANRLFWLRWERLFMGMTPSPYNAVTHFYLAEELARGSPTDPSNPCRFDKVHLNIPGSENYDSTLPWIIRWNVEANALAGDVVTFVDDLRATGHSIENAWQVGRRVASQLQWLGLQDAPRKCRPPSQTPGAWAGSVFKISKLHICKTTTQEKWENGNARLEKYVEAFHEKAYPCFDFKTMRSDVGFFVHQAMTYSCIMPFLKGFFLTMNMCRGKRDKEGWKMSKKEWILQLLGKIEVEEGLAIAHKILDLLDNEEQKHSGLTKSGQDPLIYQQENPPNQVTAVERLKDDGHAIASMFSNSTPPEVGIRSLEIFLAIYGFGNASGKGFGSAIQGDKGLSYRIWGMG